MSLLQCRCKTQKYEQIMSRKSLSPSSGLENEFRTYMSRRGLDDHTTGSYVSNIKNLIDGIIREYLERNHTSIFDISDIELIGMYLNEFRNDDMLSKINREKHNNCTAPLKKYYEFLQWKSNPNDAEFVNKPDKSTIEERTLFDVKPRAIEEVEAEISTFKKYGIPVPEALENEYREINSREFLNTLPGKLEPIFKECPKGYNFTVIYSPENGVSVIDNSSLHTTEGKPAKKMNLKVTLPDGRIIMGPTAKDTFVAAIGALGFERVEALHMLYVNHPMISDKKHEKDIYANCQVEVMPGKYLITASGTEYKKAKLEEAIRRLGEKATVELVSSDNVVDSTPMAAPFQEKINRKSPATRLQVICSDGTIINEGYASDTLIEAIRLAGPLNVKALGLTCCDVPLVSDRFDPEYRDAQKPVSNGLLVMTKSSTENKKKYLDDISRRLDLNWKVEII